MKKLLVLALCVILQSSIINHQSFAQAPKKMNYQGVVRDADGQTLVNKTVNLRLSILSADDINNPSYTEVQTVTTNAFGLFAIKIGEGNAIVGEMNNIDWSSADHFVSVELDAHNNGHYEFMGTSQLLSVPYAFYAETAGKAIDLENADQYRDIPFSGTSGQTIRSNGQEWEASSVLFNISSKIGIGTTVPSEKLDVNGNINLTQGNEIKIGGERALKLDANRNMMQGEQAGNALTSGVNNNFIGNRAGRVNTTGSNNSFIGYRAGLNNTTGDGNMFLGYRSGYSNTTGSNNFYGGLNAGYNSTTGLNNIALGTNAGFNLGDGKDNTLVGRDAGFNTTGNRNAFIGKDAGKSNTSGFNNTYIGYNTSGVDTLENATAIGANTSVTASNSVVLGNAANVGIGTSAPSDKLHLKDGNMMVEEGRIEFSNSKDNTYIGEEAGGPSGGTLAFGSVAVGNRALKSNTNGIVNVAVGSSALMNTTTGGYNVALGASSLHENTTGASNVSVGYNPLYFNTTGDFNVALGWYSMYDNETGDLNTALGAQSMSSNKYGSGNTTIGGSSDVLSDNLTNATAIGSNAKVGCNNCLVLGNNAKVGIGTTAPQDKLHVEGSIRMVDGNQQAGYVMTSDGNGTATWQRLQSLDATNGIYTPCELAQFLDIEFNSNNAPAVILDTFLWQEVIPTSNVDLAAVGVLFQSTAFPGGTLNIYDGSDTSGTLLYTGAASAMSTGWQTIELTSPIPITTGNSFTFELTAPTSFGFKLAGFEEYPGACFAGSGTDVVFRTYKLDCDTGYIISPVSENGTVSLSNIDTLFFSDGSYQVSADTADVDWTVNDTNMYAAVSGNVGIGTTTPADKLHLVGDMRLDAGKIDVKNTGGSVIIGDNAGAADDFSDNQNIFIGTQAGLVTTTGNLNAGIGPYSLANNSTGAYNVGVGVISISNVTTGSYNSALGAHALAIGGPTDEKNTAIGFEAGVNITGSSNVFIGYRAGRQRSGSNQLFIENSGADKNNALIYGEFDNNILALNANVGIGTSSPADKLHVIGNMRLDAGRIDVRNTGGSVIIGESAGLVDDFTNNRNVFIGFESGEETTSGTENTALGAYSLSSNTSGNYNTGIGKSASAKNTTGDENVAIGKFALFENQTGNNNTAIGANALDWGGSADANNTALGFEAGWNIEGSNNVYLGYRAGKGRSGSNQLFIENSSADSANALIYGRFDTDMLALNANVGIGTSNPLTMLHVQSSSTSFGWSPFSQTSAIFEQNAGSVLSLVSGNTAVSSIVMGDTDAQFMGRVRYEHDTDRMEFWTANTEKVVIQSNGNVGIGTSSPTTKLHVNGSMRIQDGTQGNGKVLTSNANGVASWQTSSSNVPVGTIVMFIGDDENIPDGWLLCDGTSFSGTTYPELQSIVGGTNTPNFKGRFPLGAKPIVSMGETQYPLKGTGGEEEVTLTIDEMPSHSHGLEYTQRSFSGSNNGASDFSGAGTTDDTGFTGGGEAHNNMPPYYTVNFIIKAN